MKLSIAAVLYGFGLLVLQIVAALPWVVALFATPAQTDEWRKGRFDRTLLNYGLGLLGLTLVLPVLLFGMVQSKAVLDFVGRIFAVGLQMSLLADFFVLIFLLLMVVWPKGGAVALAAFREGVRQPLFWLIFGLAFFLMTISPFVPYFTFGEDYVVVKELGYDTIMFAAVAFGALAASLSISEEIEGRTAVTLMSKPVSRRQFLLGKFAGILLAAMLMIAMLGTWFEGVLIYKKWWDLGFDRTIEPEPLAAWVTRTVGNLNIPSQLADFLRGALFWVNHSLETLPGLVLNLSQVMVLVALSVSLATRLPMVVNLVVVLVVYFLAHLAPVLVAIGNRAQERSPGPVSQMLSFMAQLFDTILPGLEFFRVGPTLATDVPLVGTEFFTYVGLVSLYGVLYTTIVLLMGLILFEDRDLA